MNKIAFPGEFSLRNLTRKDIFGKGFLGLSTMKFQVRNQILSFVGSHDFVPAVKDEEDELEEEEEQEEKEEDA